MTNAYFSRRSPKRDDLAQILIIVLRRAPLWQRPIFRMKHTACRTSFVSANKLSNVGAPRGLLGARQPQDAESSPPCGGEIGSSSLVTVDLYRRATPQTPHAAKHRPSSTRQILFRRRSQVGAKRNPPFPPQ